MGVTIQKRNKTWQARIQWVENNTRRSYSKSGFKTKKESSIFAQQFNIKLQNGTVTTKTVPLIDYFKDWYTTFKFPKISYITQKRYLIIEKDLKKYFKNLNLNKITRYKYQKFINEYGANHAPDSVKKLNSIVRACVKSALIDNLIDIDFTQNINLIWNEDRIKKSRLSK